MISDPKGKKAFYKQLYVRFCRAYAIHLGDRPADAIYLFLCKLKFYTEHRYWPHLKNPRTFSEKIFHRMLFDRNPQWTMLSDKWRVRDYVATRIGGEHLIPLLWEGESPERIPFAELPKRFVIKTNHGCGYNIIVEEKRSLDEEKVRRQLKEWLGTNFANSSFIGMAWAYRNIAPKILIEEFLEENGKVPIDYKLYCYAGRVEFIMMIFDRFDDPCEKIFDRDFHLVDLTTSWRRSTKNVEPPANFEKMLSLAESLAKGFDFMRIDLYNVGANLFWRVHIISCGGP